MNQPLQYELVLQQARAAQRRAGRGAVALALQPYVGATHFKDGKPLPPELLEAAAAARPGEQNHLRGGSCGFLLYLMTVCVILLFLGLFSCLTPPSYGEDCTPLSPGQWALVCAGVWGLPQAACVLLTAYALASTDSSARQAHLNVLYMLYVQDSCEGIPGASPVHVFVLGRSVYTVLSDGTYLCRVLPDIPRPVA